MNRDVGEKDSEIIQHSRDPGVHGPVAVDWEDSRGPALSTTVKGYFP